MAGRNAAGCEARARVVQAPAPAVDRPPQMLKRQCACGAYTIGGATCEKCRQSAQPILQRRSCNHAEPHIVPMIVHDVLRSPGQPLDAPTRGAMEACFGREFGDVRIHADGQAARSARAIDALAYTAGRDVVFDAHGYDPRSRDGSRLLAHELAHVAQQGNITLRQPVRIGKADDALERAADRAADALTSGRVPFVVGVSQDGAIRRQAKPAPAGGAAGKPPAADSLEDTKEQIIKLVESAEKADRQRALDLILLTYYQRPANFDGIFYNPNLNSEISPHDAETGASPGQPDLGGQQRITIGPRFFNDFRRRYDRRVRTIGHELQHVGQRSPPGGRTLAGTLGGVGLGAAIGGIAGLAGLGLAAAMGASLSAGLFGSVIGGAAAVGGLIGGIADPFARKREPIRNSHTREFLAIHWVVTANVRGIKSLSRRDALNHITQANGGALDEYNHMPQEDQKRYRRQYEEILAAKQRLESPE